MIEQRLNKVVLKKFISWYSSNYTLSINEFLKLSNDMKLGVYLNFISTFNIAIAYSYDIVFIYNISTHNVIDILTPEDKNIINISYQGIILAFEYINKPF